MSATMKRNKVKTKIFAIQCTEEEYELLHQTAALANKSGSSWGHDVLVSRALHLRWRRA